MQTEALVLRSIAFGESDRIVHLLTPETGRLTAIAKGARRSVRRFSGTLDLFNHLRVHIEQRRPTIMARLESARLLTASLPLRGHPVRFGLACVQLELLDRLAPENGSRPDMERLFRFALASLGAIGTHPPDRRLHLFLGLRALAALGLRPELTCCVRCARPLTGSATVAFHVGDGGPLCATCEPGVGGTLRVHPGTLRVLEQSLRFPLERLDRLSLGPALLQEATGLVDRFRRFHLGIELRSERFLDEILVRGAPPPARVRVPAD